MLEQDKKYILERAEAELELAQRSVDPDAAETHYRLAELYLDSVYGNAAEQVGVEEGA